uniref:hypothetical protein n=1 Tax=Pseudomonas mohnii TaxID=395600 RepID=UPI001F54C5CE|nr:hypothetical protein [Pseudomonas mohnii]
MGEFDQGGQPMLKNLRAFQSASREQQVRDLERHNLAELEIIERLMTTLGLDAFETEIQRLVSLHKIDVLAPIQSIGRWRHPSLIGMTDGPFEVLSRVCEQLVVREPKLLQRPSYRCRNQERIAIPLTLWLDFVRYARECFDPAALDADFLLSKMREGLSSREAFDALIASKRNE